MHKFEIDGVEWEELRKSGNFRLLCRCVSKDIFAD